MYILLMHKLFNLWIMKLILFHSEYNLEFNILLECMFIYIHTLSLINKSYP